jgi:polysaccharide export outer membrane protein
MYNTNCVRLAAAVCCLLLIASCDPSRRINKDYLYFQNDRKLVLNAKVEEITFKPKDLLAIQVISNSLNQDQTALFNLGGQQGYLVDAEGKIDMPLIGEVNVAGQTREQLEKNLENKIRPHVLNPQVKVRIQNFSVNVMGDVGGPGTKTFANDRVTILDAISASGDLLPTGRRDNVTVIRDDGKGNKQIHEIDLRSTTLFSSPVYQLHQNDIVYVNANEQKLKSLKEQKAGFTQVLQAGLSVIGLATSLYILFRNNN